MSTSSRTPDDKMHRYLQRIQKLVGHRGKSPVMIKSRNKSPMSVKTTRLDDLLKYELFFKSLIKFYQMNSKRYKKDFLDKLEESRQPQYQKYRIHTPSSQARSFTSRYFHNKKAPIQLIERFIQNRINNQLAQSLQAIKSHILQRQNSNLRVNINHRRTYSQIFADTIQQTRTKSPSAIYNYEYRTPEVIKINTFKEKKSNQAKIFVNCAKKIIHKSFFAAFSQIKSQAFKFTLLQQKQLQIMLEQNQKKLDLANKQLSSFNKKIKNDNSSQKQLQQLKQNLKTANSDIKQLQTQLISTNKLAQNLGKENESLKKMLQMARKQDDSAKRYLETHKKQLQLASKELESVRRQLDLGLRESKQVKQENEKLKRDLLRLKKEVESKSKQFDDSKQQILVLTQQMQYINEQLAQTKQKLQTIQRETRLSPKVNNASLRQLQRQKEQFQTQKEYLYTEKKQLQQGIKQVQTQLKKQISLRKELQSTIQSKQKQLLVLRNQIDAQRKNINHEKTKIQSQQKQISSIKQQLQNQQKELSSLKQQLQIKQQELQSLQNLFQHTDKKLTQRQMQLQNQLKILESAKNQFESSKKKSQLKTKQNDSIIHIQLSQKDSQISSLKKQLLQQKQNLNQLSNSLLQSQKIVNQQNHKLSVLAEKQLSKEKQLQITESQKKQDLLTLQRKIAALLIHNLFYAKITSIKSKSMEAISNVPSLKSSLRSKSLLMQKLMNGLVFRRQKFFMESLVYGFGRINEKEPQILDRSITQQIKMKSLNSSKLSASNASMISSGFDIFAKKLNKAFELKTTLKEIYSYGFQKIDYAALTYLGLFNPLNKVIENRMKQGMRKIQLYSFLNANQGESSYTFQDEQMRKKGEHIFHLLRKVDNKIVFTKIQAYSILKLNYELRKSLKIPDQSIISQKELKRELKDFLQQRNKMYQKTFQTWEKTKEMIQDYKIASSQRAY